MNSFAFLLAPLALLLPAVAAGLPDASTPQSETARATPEAESAPVGLESPAAAPFRVLDNARKTPTENQVRIEQRVIVRIAPSSPRTVARSMDRIAEDTDRFEEERVGDCVPIGAIAAVQPANNNRLLFFMRDRRVLSAALERSCNSEDYYLGFYVERSGDGQLCSRRDKLQSRAGASCRFTKLSRLVAERD
ncbi:hypothetical protein [Altererythrobacter sp. Root672]|uniref:hypothetical protein n=1 Tax=Altererythrobacter sp. Root672 TaxID=1736584 RepID=UPI0006F57655|nr:hypothetical protein [Altererythrobacter sp. Root672]KRA83068.1 hypothetical protein ASD76_03055 [Altererythrobacter sp. Root672]